MSIQNRPSVSVIIPVYNVEDYVEKCLSSVMNQTLKDIEIIVIDDGSTDSSPAIVDRIAETDSRIKVVHSENGGVSAARNKGLSIANGRYIGFVDSDDYIEPDMYEKMLSVAEKNKCDIVQCGFYSGDIDINNVEREKGGVYDRHHALLNSLKTAGGTVWNKLFLSEKIGHLRFDERCFFGEDRLFSIDSFLICERLVVIEDIYYHYVFRQGSIVHSKPGRKNIDALQYLDYLFEKADGDDELCRLAMREKAGALIYLLEIFIVTKDVERSLIEEVENRILAMKDWIKDMDYVSFKQKIAIKTFFISPRLYTLLVKVKHVFS